MGKKPTPLVTLSIEDFQKLLDKSIKEALKGKQSGRTKSSNSNEAIEGRFVYGIKGIEKLFGVCHKTAQEYKNTILKSAVKQKDRKIVVDVDKALQLFAQSNKSKRRCKQ